MSYHDWHAGMKVTYVGGSRLLSARRGVRRLFGKWSTSPTGLVAGAVYEIAEIGVGTNRMTGEEEVGVQLKDDPDTPFDGMHPARCFRPVQTRKTDIAVFTSMLTGPKVPAYNAGDIERACGVFD